MLILMVLHVEKTKHTQVENCEFGLCVRMFLSLSLYLKFGHGTHNIDIILHVAVFNSLKT